MGKKLKLENREYTYPEIETLVTKGSREDIERLTAPETLRFLEECGDLDSHMANRLTWSMYQQLIDEELGRGHVSYWNSAFYVANRFNLGEIPQRRSAVVVVWNGRHKYFEWITYNGGEFDNATLFSDLGLVTCDEAGRFRDEARSCGRYYHFLPRSIEDRLVEHFSLTDSEIASAHLVCGNVLQKERTNNSASGQYLCLPVRGD